MTLELFALRITTILKSSTDWSSAKHLREAKEVWPKNTLSHYVKVNDSTS